MTEPSVLLVDASPYIFRAHFALPSSIVDVEGRPSNAVYGFGSFLLKLIGEEGPTHLGVAFDRSLSTSFRNELYPEYKQHRDAPPADLEAQLEDCETLARSIGAAAFSDARFEADDLLAALCDLTAPHRATVVTSDKDLSQLVDSRVEWLDYGKGLRYGPVEVEERFGVGPARIPDLLGLAGDPVDNIPGVEGIGPKTALSLLERFESVEALCQDPGSIADLGLRGGARIQRLIEEQGDRAILSKELATVVRSVALPTTLDDLVLAPPRRPELDRLFERLGFESLLQRILERA